MFVVISHHDILIVVSAEVTSVPAEIPLIMVSMPQQLSTANGSQKGTEPDDLSPSTVEIWAGVIV